MTAEPHRLQYLEAMGLTAWVARYRLPNARPSEACDWELPAAPEPTPPGERLHALLDEQREAPSAPPAAPPPGRESRPAGPGRARRLLVGDGPEEAPSPAASADTPRVPEAELPALEPLRFALQVACLDGRWLLLLPGARAPDAVSLRLLGNLLRAAGVVPEQPPAFQAFHWPQVEGLPVEAPLEEAREGLSAFIDGAGRRGWAPERVLVFGRDETLDRLLNLTEGRCELLALPGWQGPALETLAGSAEAKRALWPALAGWRNAWRGSDEAPGNEPRDGG